MHNIILKRAKNAIRELQNLVNIKHTKNVCGKLIFIYMYTRTVTHKIVMTLSKNIRFHHTLHGFFVDIT